jgi:hypothetical protein
MTGLTIDITGAHVFSITVSVLSALLGYWVRRLYADQKETYQLTQALRAELAQVREQFAREIGNYVHRTEFQELAARIEMKLDRLNDKLLDFKQDKR